MSVCLLGSSLVTATLIEPQALQTEDEERHIEGGPAADRALAYLAHGEGLEPINPWFGEIFGTIYDASTVVILSFAGLSAMAGLLNLVPQYLPRYGMAPEWSRAVRPLVLLFTAINLLVTWIFNADVQAQGGAYATGVLVLMSSACVATLIDHWRASRGHVLQAHALAVCRYLRGLHLHHGRQHDRAARRAEDRQLVHRGDSRGIVWLAAQPQPRSCDSKALNSRTPRRKFLWDSLKHLEFPVLVPHRPGRRGLDVKEASIRERHRLAPEVPIVFIEAELGDPSEFQQSPLMEVCDDGQRFIISVKRCASTAHVIAVVALELSRVGRPPEIHFGWSDENPLAAAVGFFLFGEGNVPWRVRDLIRKAEPDTDRHPQVIIG